MSDYYGRALLEDWLKEEHGIEPAVENVALFEKWRSGIESQIQSWMDSDDGYGNRLSWRGWGRGLYGIPDAEWAEFQAAKEKARPYTS